MCSWLPRTTPTQFYNISKDGDFTAFLGNLFQCSATLTVKNCFLMFRDSLPCFGFCPLPLAPSLGITEKCLGSIFFATSLQVFTHLNQILLSLLFSRLNNPSSLSLSLQERRSSPFIIFMALCYSMNIFCFLPCLKFRAEKKIIK